MFYEVTLQKNFTVVVWASDESAAMEIARMAEDIPGENYIRWEPKLAENLKNNIAFQLIGHIVHSVKGYENAEISMPDCCNRRSNDSGCYIIKRGRHYMKPEIMADLISANIAGNQSTIEYILINWQDEYCEDITNDYRC